MNRNEERDVAYHEAGHAVAAIAVGMSFKSVSIIPSESSWGRLLLRKMSDFHPDVERDRRTVNLAKKYMFAALGGPVSEKKRGRGGGLGEGDVQEVFNMAARLCGSFEETEAYVNFTWCQVEQSVKLNWKAIRIVVRQLIKCKTLKCQEVKALIQDELSPVLYLL